MNELDPLWALLVAGAAALVLTPLAARFAIRVGAVATPRDRDLHDSPTPRMGGLAILAGVLLAGALFLPGDEQYRGILLGAAAAALIGALDDKYDLPPAVKLAGQFLAALIPVASGVYVHHVTLPFVEPLDLHDLGGPLTLVGIVAAMNVVNFPDGADGLAAGVCTIAAVPFAVIALSLDRDAAGILAALTAGGAAG